MANRLTHELNVNGTCHAIQAEPDTPLIYILRNQLGLTGTKLGCALEQCGACRVLVDGQPTYSCTEPVSAIAGRAITTVEGLATDNRLSPLQEAFVAQRAGQCGYCTAGMLIAATALLQNDPAPDLSKVRAALQPHLCRCGSHPRIERAVLSAAGVLT